MTSPGGGKSGCTICTGGGIAGVADGLGCGGGAGCVGGGGGGGCCCCCSYNSVAFNPKLDATASIAWIFAVAAAAATAAAVGIT